MRSFPPLLGSPREWAQDLAIATALGVFLGVIGPFGSFNGGPIELRIAYWVTNLWIGFVILTLVVRLSMRAATRLDLPIWFALAIGAALGSLPAGLAISHFSAWFWPGARGRPSPFLVWYGQTLAIAEPYAFGYYFLGVHGLLASRSGMWRAPAPDAASPPEAGDFLDRLPPRLGRDLICLKMEDHYVRAHTATGSDLVLLPLKDAIAELKDVEGLQVHRSWWVARAGVVAAESRGRNHVLRLRNGLEAPVSRAMVATLRAAGWLAQPETA